MGKNRGSRNTGGSGQTEKYNSYPELPDDLNEFAKAWADLRIADDVMREVGDYLGDIMEYQYDDDEYEFMASGWRERVEEYVYETLGYPRYNEAIQKVEAIAQKIAEGTGLDELSEADSQFVWNTWPNLVKFAEENGVTINRPDTPFTKFDLDGHF